MEEPPGGRPFSIGSYLTVPLPAELDEGTATRILAATDAVDRKLLLVRRNLEGLLHLAWDEDGGEGKRWYFFPSDNDIFVKVTFPDAIALGEEIRTALNEARTDLARVRELADSLTGTSDAMLATRLILHFWEMHAVTMFDTLLDWSASRRLARSTHYIVKKKVDILPEGSEREKLGWPPAPSSGGALPDGTRDRLEAGLLDRARRALSGLVQSARNHRESFLSIESGHTWRVNDSNEREVRVPTAQLDEDRAKDRLFVFSLSLARAKAIRNAFRRLQEVTGLAPGDDWRRDFSSYDELAAWGSQERYLQIENWVSGAWTAYGAFYFFPYPDFPRRNVYGELPPPPADD